MAKEYAPVSFDEVAQVFNEAVELGFDISQMIANGYQYSGRWHNETSKCAPEDKIDPETVSLSFLIENLEMFCQGCGSYIKFFEMRLAGWVPKMRGANALVACVLREKPTLKKFMMLGQGPTHAQQYVKFRPLHDYVLPAVEAAEAFKESYVAPQEEINEFHLGLVKNSIGVRAQHSERPIPALDRALNRVLDDAAVALVEELRGQLVLGRMRSGYSWGHGSSYAGYAELAFIERLYGWEKDILLLPSELLPWAALQGMSEHVMLDSKPSEATREAFRVLYDPWETSGSGVYSTIKGALAAAEVL